MHAVDAWPIRISETRQVEGVRQVALPTEAGMVPSAVGFSLSSAGEGPLDSWPGIDRLPLYLNGKADERVVLEAVPQDLSPANRGHVGAVVG